MNGRRDAAPAATSRPTARTTTAVLRRAGRAWRRYPKLAGLAVGALVVQAAFSAWLAYSLKDIVNDVTRHRPSGALQMLLAELLVGFVVTAVAAVVGEKAAARAAAHIVNDIRRRLYAQVLHLSPDYFVSQPPSKVINRFANDVTTLAGGYVEGFLDTVVLLVSALILLPLLVWLDWRLAAITCVSLPLVIVVVDRLLPGWVDADGALSGAESEVITAVNETIGAHRVVRTFHLEHRLVERFDHLLETEQQRAVHARGLAARVVKGSSMGVLLVQVAVVVTGGELAAHQVITVGSLVAFVTVLSLATKNVYDFARVDLPRLGAAGRAAHAIDELLHAPIDVSDPACAGPLPPIEGAISFRDVRFSYAPGHPALSGVSFEIPPQGSVAVVGANGSGKSTVLSLLLRLYDPQQGSITIDGHDLREVTQRSFRSQMAVVLQDNFTFHDTIRENIRVGDLDASDEEVTEAAKRAELHDFVAGLPQGYDTIVGELGGRLSRGLSQRLAIARAMIRDPRVLLLDEVTTNLDPATEASVHEMLARVARDRTVISVTHRLAAARGADEILVFHQGQLIERGRHDDLHAADGVYRALWEKQSGFDVSRDGRQAGVDPGRLRHIELFAALEPDTLSGIAAQMRPEYYEADQVVFYEGEPGDRFYLIARGQVAVLAFDSNGDEHQLDALGDGDYFGELALVDDQPRTASIRTKTPCLFLTMARADFLRLVASTPEMTSVLEERMARSRATLNEWHHRKERSPA